VRKTESKKSRKGLPPDDMITKSLVTVGLLVGFGTVIRRGTGQLDLEDILLIIGLATGALTALTGGAVAARTMQTEAAAKFEAAAEEALATVKSSLPSHGKSLEQEISDVSDALIQSISKLREISENAQAFEGEVRALVERAESAQAMAELNESQASKISLLLSERTEQRLTDEIEKLKVAHAEQADRQRKSSNRVALLTFVGGVILGVVGNVLTNLLML
jgi:CRISPR/Cas system CMR-associated protein Cmr1 (group 7 of RAMP superfamily)